MVTLAERHDRGHGLQGIHYPPAFDEWCHELLCISPAAYRLFCSHFGGRTERSFHQIRSKDPIFRPGVTPCAYTRARQYCADYNYPLDGPLAIGVDDTALLEAIRPFFDPVLEKWYAIGLVGDPVEVIHDNADEFRQQLDDLGQVKAGKLRLWTLQIPLAHVPPLILTVAAISSATNSSMLAQMDEDLLRVLLKQEEPLTIISIGSDGAISERKGLFGARVAPRCARQRKKLCANRTPWRKVTVRCTLRHGVGAITPWRNPIKSVYTKVGVFHGVLLLCARLD
jgi:hypothetical protein